MHIFIVYIYDYIYIYVLYVCVYIYMYIYILYTYIIYIDIIIVYIITYTYCVSYIYNVHIKINQNWFIPIMYHVSCWMTAKCNHAIQRTLAAARLIGSHLQRSPQHPCCPPPHGKRCHEFLMAQEIFHPKIHRRHKYDQILSGNSTIFNIAMENIYLFFNGQILVANFQWPEATHMNTSCFEIGWWLHRSATSSSGNTAWNWRSEAMQVHRPLDPRVSTSWVNSKYCQHMGMSQNVRPGGPQI